MISAQPKLRIARIWQYRYHALWCIQWKGEIDSKVVLPDGSPLPVLLVCNKIDLCADRDAELPQLRQHLDEFCRQEGFIGWFDTSAKMNINVAQAAQHLVEYILEKHEALLTRKKDETQVTVRPFFVSILYSIFLSFSFTRLLGEQQYYPTGS